MAFVNYNNKEITVKIVYYGPALSGKTTCLKYIYENKDFQKKGKLITLDTDGDRTLFFDFLPIEIGKLGDYSIKMQLYTVPGQVAYNATRKLVLQGADGVVFVADSQVVIREQNIESIQNLKENLEANNIPYNEIPIIMQYNKRDLKEILPIENLNRDLNPENKSFFPTVATSGENIHEGLHAIMKMVIIYLKNKLSIFQRDKTVMFTRDEIAAAALNGDEFNIGDSGDDIKSVEDTESEEIFELSGPLKDEDESKEIVDTQSEDDIFNLDDNNILDKMESKETAAKEEVSDDLVVGIQENSQEEILELNSSEGDYDTNEDDIFEEKKLDGSDSEKINVPLEIEIPKGAKEHKININLQIVVKRK